MGNEMTYDRRAGFSAQGASKIDLKDIPKEQQKVIDILSPNGFRPYVAWDGNHGYVIEFKGIGRNPRMSKAVLKDLINLSVFRWLEADSDGSIAVGV
jgi:hypothetical protein